MAAVAKVDPNVKTPEETGETPTVQPVGGKPKLIILLALVALVLLEVIGMYLIIPGPKQTKLAVDKEQNERMKDPVIPIEPLDPDREIKPKAGELVSYPIPDPFVVENSTQGGGTVMRISAKFVLRYNKADDVEFQKKIESELFPIQSNIITILRSASFQEIEDPKNTVLRNKILKSVNETFGEPLVKEVIIIGFSAQVM